MENISIFAIVLYLIITNSFIHLTAKKYKKDIIIKFNRLIKFKYNKLL